MGLGVGVTEGFTSQQLLFPAQAFEQVETEAFLSGMSRDLFQWRPCSTGMCKHQLSRRSTQSRNNFSSWISYQIFGSTSLCRQIACDRLTHTRNGTGHTATMNSDSRLGSAASTHYMPRPGIQVGGGSVSMLHQAPEYLVQKPVFLISFSENSDFNQFPTADLPRLLKTFAQHPDCGGRKRPTCEFFACCVAQNTRRQTDVVFNKVDFAPMDQLIVRTKTLI